MIEQFHNVVEFPLQNLNFVAPSSSSDTVYLYMYSSSFVLTLLGLYLEVSAVLISAAWRSLR